MVLGADNPNNKRKDFVIVKFVKPEAASACIDSTDGSDLKGRWVGQAVGRRLQLADSGGLRWRSCVVEEEDVN